MKQRIFYLLKIYLTFICFFLLTKIIFLVSNFDLTKEAGFLNSVPVLWHGLRLDLSASAYLMLIPLILLLVCSLLHKPLFKKVVSWYLGAIAILLSLILVSDLELYKYWGFRLDVTPILYLKTPGEAMASVSIWVIARQLLIAALLSFALIWVFKQLLKNFSEEKYRIVEAPVYLFLLAFMIVPIRGGLGIAPINVGSAYFSQNNYLNHASINVYWNLANSLAGQNDQSKKYKYFSSNEADSIVKPYLNGHDLTGDKFLNTPKPNIVLIMMESFTANVIKPLGGLPNITPSLNKLAGEGMLFTNLYSAGDRSDKGLMAILSGYPAQTTFSIIKDAAKTQTLPKLPLDLKLLGYNTAFYYGGDLNFANMRSYLVSAGFNTLISKSDFPASSYNSKWGAHDEVVFNRLLSDLNTAKGPFFKMIFTLSSHEPFEVPVNHIRGTDEASKFLNSVYYTDSCLGAFFEKAKQQPWWKNTWIIIVADHGIRLPGNLKVHDPKKFHIPMLWLGGAINKTMKVEKAASQIDIPLTVLNQLGTTNNYLFSRNIFGRNQKTDAFYVFNNGIGVVNDSMDYVFDCTKKSVIQDKNPVPDSLVNVAKAYIQIIYSDLKKRK